MGRSFGILYLDEPKQVRQPHIEVHRFEGRGELCHWLCLLIRFASQKSQGEVEFKLILGPFGSQRSPPLTCLCLDHTVLHIAVRSCSEPSRDTWKPGEFAIQIL